MRHSPVRLKLRHFTQLLVLSTLFILVLFAYQNCAAPLSEQEELSSVAANTSFAFEAKIDRLAYMSCSYASGGAFFSFRAGAYGSDTGVRLSPKFQKETGGYSPDKRVEVLQASDSDGAQFQLSMRQSGNLQNVYSSTGQPGYGNYGFTLTESPVVTTLANSYNGKYFNSFGGLPLSADLDYQSGGVAISVRDNLSAETGIIATTFALAGSGPDAFSPGGTFSPDKVYGYGYKVNFSMPSHITSGGTEWMTKIDEVNLETGKSSGGTWYCDPNLRFVIVRDGDQGAGYPCSATPTSSEPAPSAVLTELRKVLPVSEWSIDLANKCIVAKAGSCYQNSVTIKYPPASGTTTCTSTSPETCAHYLTICKRM